MGRRTVGRAALCVALAFVAACASSGSNQLAAVHEMLRLAGSREADPPRDGSEAFVVDTLTIPSSRVFMAARRAYERLGVPFTHYDDQALRLGGFVQVLGDLGEERPSAWIDCGRGATAQVYADQYQVSMAIATRVVALPDGRSTLETVIRARARARDVSSDLLRCRSFGTFERRIASLVRDGEAD